jgi:serine/threonine-protein kinase
MRTTVEDSIDRFAPQGDGGDFDLVAQDELGGQYRIDRLLEKRAGAVAYFAHEADRRRPVVLRVRDRRALEQIAPLDALDATLSEIAALEHPHIVPLYHFGHGPRTVWWTTQFVRAPSLADLVRAESPIPLERVAAIAKQIAAALDHAHDHGIAHGQVSPDTIVVREADWAVLDDFAIVSARAERPATPSGDQRDLALTIYRVLMAELDRSAASIATSLASPLAMVGRRPDLPASVASALARAMEPDPAQQFGSPMDLVAALRPGPARVTTPSIMLPDDGFEAELAAPPPRKSVPRRQWINAGALVASLAAGVGVIAWHPWASDGGTWSGFGASVMDTIVASPPPRTEALVPAVPPEPAPLPPPAPAPMAVTPPPPPPVATPKPVAIKPARLETRSIARSKPPAQRAPARRPAAPPKRVQAGSVAIAPSAAPGRLFVSSRPWGQLYVDEKLIGPTPKAAVTIPAGQHLVRIARPGFRTVERSITVEPGADVRLIDLVLEAAR